MSGVVIGGECQIPYHNRAIWKSFLEFIRTYSPDQVILIGDFLDCPAPARWNRGTAAEYAGKLQAELDLAKRMLQELRSVYGGYLGMHIGNHEARINTYARTKAPALSDLKCLEVSNLLDFEGFEIEQRKPIHNLSGSPGWVTTHGDLGSLSRHSGGTALALGRRLGRSVFCGHTHRLGIVNESYGLGATSTVVGVESGHMMDVRKAEYIRHGSPNWQGGWAVAEVSNRRTWPALVYCAQNGNITWMGPSV